MKLDKMKAKILNTIYLSGQTINEHFSLIIYLTFY